MPERQLRQEELRALEDNEHSIVAGRALEAQRLGRPVGPSELYPDIKLPHSTGYTRQGVPLLPLSLLYERLVVYVPPADQRSLHARWGLNYADFLKLVEHGLIQPLVGHLVDYTAPHFRLLFESYPVPSVWARGLTLLSELGLEDTLNPKLYSFDFDQLASQPSLIQKFRRHFPRYGNERLQGRIKSELLTNLADLALFGEHELVEALESSASSMSPDELARTILLLSEIRAYPTLFGLGGTANYDSRYVASLPSLGQSIDWALHKQGSRAFGQTQYQGLLDGIGIDPDTLTSDEVIDFHGSGDAKLLRKAVAAFEREAHKIAVTTDVGDLSPVLAEARELDRIFAETTRELINPATRQRYAREKRISSWLVQVGGLAVGGWIGGEVVQYPPFGAIGGAAIVNQAIVAPMKQRITDAIMSRRFRPGLANLWKIKRRNR